VKARKTDKTVADMGVLKDIRGLLSASRESPAKEPSAKPAPDLDAEKAAIEEKLKQSQSAAKDMQAAISRLEAEKKGLEARVAALQSAVNSLPPPPSVTPRSAEALPAGTDRLARDVSDLEAQKEELSRALSEIEALLQIKIKDLARRIARVYEEAGDIGASRDFRRITSQLEASENFGEFIRALSRE
jgi:chromosome segregation ATPase